MLRNVKSCIRKLWCSSITLKVSIIIAQHDQTNNILFLKTYKLLSFARMIEDIPILKKLLVLLVILV